MLMIGLLVVAVMVAIGFVMRRRAAAQQPALAGAGGLQYATPDAVAGLIAVQRQFLQQTLTPFVDRMAGISARESPGGYAQLLRALSLLATAHTGIITEPLN